MRRLVGLVLLVAVSLAVPQWAVAQEAQDQGWWWTASRQGLPAAPAPPDMAADDLLVQGGDVLRLAGRPAAPTAVSALRFHLAAGDSVAALALPVAAGGRADDVRAYATTATWQPVQGGPLAEAPAPDVTRYCAGRLSADGTTLLFPDIGRLVTEDGLLSLLLVAGPTDRLVLHRPPPTALTVVEAPAVPAPLVPAPAAAPSGPAPASFLAPVQSAVAPGTAAAVVPAPAPAVARPPVLAVATPVRHLVADDRRTRVIVALEAVLLLLTFGLLGHGPMAAAARLLGPQPVSDGDRGVGRFRRPREGPAPRL
jgi:hypothetical protein